MTQEEQLLLDNGETNLEQLLACQGFKEMQEDRTTSQDQLKKFEVIIKIILTRLKVLSAGKLMLLLQPEIHLIGIKFIEQLNICMHYARNSTNI